MVTWKYHRNFNNLTTFCASERNMIPVHYRAQETGSLSGVWPMSEENDTLTYHKCIDCMLHQNVSSDPFSRAVV